ncbi:hypothetical protein [Chryseobacterium sp.]|uniref:hypothetical protein n=1 Tax=Chryseobacterium sp. TaxID=1871047 RepID=UPI0011CBCE8D|nr:hypothetical protein [Chryseobacterium sp.]TXF79492.1 hypothetical protein FUA25_03670 [Chryseobacterium sp.]
MDKYYLMIPIYELYSIQELDEVTFDRSVAEYLKDQRSLKDRKKIYSALEWAKENPNYDFKDIMKDAPVSHELSFSNSEISDYLMSFKTFMENKDFKLLTEDRPIKEPKDFL